MNGTEKSIIDQAARDYGMECHEVEKIYKLHHPDRFYEMLEDFIEDRKTAMTK